LNLLLNFPLVKGNSSNIFFLSDLSTYNHNIESVKILGKKAQRHQKFVAEYISENSPYRGLLLYHGLGSGKTAASLLISEGFPKKKCIVMLPASLEQNFIGEINTFSTIKQEVLEYWVMIYQNIVNYFRIMELIK